MNALHNFSDTAADDHAYMACFQRGDKREAQRLVEKAAQDHGFSLGPLFHATDREFFVFTPGFRGWIFFATKRIKAMAAARCARRPNIVISAYIRTSHVLGTPNTRIDFRQMECAKAAAVHAQGYDSVWVDDEAGRTLAVRSSSQIKLADPFVFDANGNLLPLSRRFADTPDIRGVLAA